jgi:uncharacterized protein YceK
VRSILLISGVLFLAGCGAQVEATFETISIPEATATPEATAPAATAMAPSSTPGVSLPGSVTITFRLTLTGAMPDDAVFALQTGIVGVGGGANYLCSYYGGYPVCAAGATYDEVHAFAPGTRVAYRFWRELDVNGTSEEIEASDITVGITDQVISVGYDFPPLMSLRR